MASKKGRSEAGQDKSLSVAEYSRLFIEKYLKQEYGPTKEENERVAGENFHALVKKLQEAGSKEDVKVPLRILRDEIGRVFFSSPQRARAEAVHALFRLYDAVEGACQAELREGRDTKALAGAAQLLEDLRDRFTRLAVGETWEAYPDLRFLAIKRMYTYAVKEAEGQPRRVTGGGGPGLSRSFSKKLGGRTSNPGSEATWQTAINDLGKAPSAKVLPLLKLLLAENAALAKSLATQDTAAGKAAADKAAEEQQQQQEAQRKAASFNLDDLLGLDQVVLGPGGEEPPSPAAPLSTTSSSLAVDPFKASSEPYDTPRGPFSAPSSGFVSPGGSGTMAPAASYGSGHFPPGPSLSGGFLPASLPTTPTPQNSGALPGFAGAAFHPARSGSGQLPMPPSQAPGAGPSPGGFDTIAFPTSFPAAPAPQPPAAARLPMPPQLNSTPSTSGAASSAPKPSMLPPPPAQAPQGPAGGSPPERTASGAAQPPAKPPAAASSPATFTPDFGEFNPFGLGPGKTAEPSPAQRPQEPAPSSHGNGFADGGFGESAFGSNPFPAPGSQPAASAAPAEVPKPMRAPPAPPTSNSFSAWG